MYSRGNQWLPSPEACRMVLKVRCMHNLPLDGMVNIPMYLVWEYWVQLNSILFADHVTFNNEYVSNAPIQGREYQIMIITTIKGNKFDTSDNPDLPSYATTVTLKFKLKYTLTQK